MRKTPFNLYSETIALNTRVRARGAVSNMGGRFEATHFTRFDDGWEIDEDKSVLHTEIRIERPRSALNFVRSPDLPFDRTINPYRGCEHGCIYCYARPSHAYLNLSPGLDFETKLIARPGIDRVLEKELRKKSYYVAPVALGTNTDPYQPCEVKYGVMRSVIDVLARFNHPMTITTKGVLIEHDIGLLAPMATRGLVQVGISLTTLDADLSRSLEPRAPHPQRRLMAMKRLSDAGIPVRAMLSPIIPGLNDHEIENLLKAAADAGASSASWIAIRLPREVSELFKEWLNIHFPQRANKVMARICDMHGGKEYDANWSKRMQGQGLWAELIAQRFTKATKRLALNQSFSPLRCDLFAAPPCVGDQLLLL